MNKFHNFQFSIFDKIGFIFKKPKVIIVSGAGRACAKEAIFSVMKNFFSLGKEILIFESDLKSPQILERAKFLIKNSSLPILVVSHLGEIPFDRNYFAGEEEDVKNIKELAKSLPPFGYLILNFDDETVRGIKEETNLKEITFGFQKNADFCATDLITNGGTNFKINYKGNVVPVWLEKVFGKEQVYSALTAIAVGTVFDLNLVEISQSLKDYSSLPGKMRLIDGIKNSKILDDSDSANISSMIEAIEVLGKIQKAKRRIAVLGDVIGVEKYAIEAHERVGEEVAKNVDLLFTFGPRAKFIAETAKNKGMPIDKIFQFDTIEEGKLKIQNEIKEGDVVLVDGSKEMKMGEIVEEIKKM